MLILYFTNRVPQHELLAFSPSMSLRADTAMRADLNLDPTLRLRFLYRRRVFRAQPKVINVMFPSGFK